VPDGVDILAAPGTEILIRMLPRLAEGGAAILRTSYRSYAESWVGSGRLRAADIETLQLRPGESLVAVSPNNPDGRIAEPRLLLALAREHAPGRLVVVDEAYGDCVPEGSLLPGVAPDDPVLVLHSFGKFYGLPGLRLGFAIGRPDLIGRLAAMLGDWPVSGPALAIGTAALRDDAWRAATRHWLGNQAQAMDAVLLAGGLRIAGGCSLFRAARPEDAPAMHERLARHGIWTRIFEDWPGLIRFGLPGDAARFDRVAGALAAR
jgi:cobalamin biosynthetic protein CobC